MNHTIIHIGSGEGPDLEWQIAVNPKRLILIEPNPNIAARLRERTFAFTNVEVHEMAVMASEIEERIATLHEFNWNSVSSLQEVAALAQLFPGLRIVRNHQVKVISPAKLIERLVLDKDEEHMLIIEAPAAEVGIIDALCDSGQIGMFSELKLSCPSADLYAGNADPKGLMSRLATHGFETVEQDESDPDWPVYGLKRNRWRYELQQSEKQLKALEVQLADLLEEKRTLEQITADRNHELDEKSKLINEYKTHLDQMTNAREAQAKLATDRLTQVKKLTETAEQETKLLGEIETKLAQTTKSRDEQALLLMECQKRVSELEYQLTDAEQRQSRMAEEMRRAEGQIDLIADLLLRDSEL